MAAPTAAVGVLLTGASQVGGWGWPVVVAVPLLMLCGLSVHRSMRRHADPWARARIVQAVSAG